jgi:DNA-binding NtrC family response regulator
MRAGRFREDLFYRLNVIPLVVPPLRERPEDIPLLIDHVLKSLRKRGLDRVRAVSPEAMRRLMEYPWPGNVRELENVLERGAVCSRGAVLGMEDIADEVREHGRPRPSVPPAVPAADPLATRDDAPLRSTDAATTTGERDLLLRALEEHRWNKGAAAASLGIDRSTLWRKMKRLGIA